jgi:hypothetical protein
MLPGIRGRCMPAATTAILRWRWHWRKTQPPI